MATPLFGGWTPTYEGDPCQGGHPPQSVTNGSCGRCGRSVDPSPCLCGEESHRSGLSRSMCPTRMRFDKRDAENFYVNLFSRSQEITRDAINAAYGTDPRHSLLATAITDAVLLGTPLPWSISMMFGRRLNYGEEL